MSQDPYSGYGSNPDNPYGNPPPQNPDNPYGQPGQNPYGQPPYGQAPQNPYGQPGQIPYGQPPYGQPAQDPYASAPYGAPQGQGYAPPVESTPLPLGEAIRQLPNQYIRVLTKPSAQTFAAEMGKASWDITWIQLLIYAILGALLSYLATVISPNRFNFSASSSTAALPASTLQAITLGTSLGLIIFIPLGFFISEGIFFLVARAFRGTGTFLQQNYTALLFGVPLGILSLLLSLIPILGSIVSIAISIYNIVLHVFSIMAVHRLSGGKATLVVLLPAIVGLLLACGIFVFIIVVVAAAMRH